MKDLIELGESNLGSTFKGKGGCDRGAIGKVIIFNLLKRDEEVCITIIVSLILDQ